MKIQYRLIALIAFFISCKSEKDVAKYTVCNQILVSNCDGEGDEEYCTFGFKWGDNNPFANAGLGGPGPSVGVNQISYYFQTSNFKFSTHSEENLISKLYEDFSICAKDKIREAFSEWQSVANIEFIEKTNDENCDIRIIVAEIRQNGLGYPPYPDKPCSEMSGQLIFNSLHNHSCESFYRLALHEIGHVLGLGHVKSNNIMNPDKHFLELKLGDIKGVQSIYGSKR
jgi:hypothetical protein